MMLSHRQADFQNFMNRKKSDFVEIFVYALDRVGSSGMTTNAGVRLIKSHVPDVVRNQLLKDMNVTYGNVGMVPEALEKRCKIAASLVGGDYEVYDMDTRPATPEDEAMAIENLPQQSRLSTIFTARFRHK